MADEGEVRGIIKTENVKVEVIDGLYQADLD